MDKLPDPQSSCKTPDRPFREGRGQHRDSDEKAGREADTTVATPTVLERRRRPFPFRSLDAVGSARTRVSRQLAEARRERRAL